MPTVASHPLGVLAEDVRAARWLLPGDDPLRAYLDLLGALPADAEAWLEVLGPWLDDARRGLGPGLDAPGRQAVAGALGVAALRAAREVDHPPLEAALRAAARWCFFLVRPAAH